MIALPQLESGAVKGVRSSLGNVIHYPTQITAVFRIEIGYDLQLSDIILIAEKD